MTPSIYSAPDSVLRWLDSASIDEMIAVSGSEGVHARHTPNADRQRYIASVLTRFSAPAFSVTLYVQQDVNMYSEYVMNVYLHNVDQDDIDAPDYKAPIPLITLDENDEDQTALIAHLLSIDTDTDEVTIPDGHLLPIIATLLPAISVSNLVDLHPAA